MAPHTVPLGQKNVICSSTTQSSSDLPLIYCMYVEFLTSDKIMITDKESHHLTLLKKMPSCNLGTQFKRLFYIPIYCEVYVCMYVCACVFIYLDLVRIFFLTFDFGY